jgi:hypothetical protein
MHRACQIKRTEPNIHALQIKHNRQTVAGTIRLVHETTVRTAIFRSVTNGSQEPATSTFRV